MSSTNNRLEENKPGGPDRAAGYVPHGLPFLWPLVWALELGAAEAEAARKGFERLAEAERVNAPPPSSFATENRVLLDLTTLRLRDYAKGAQGPAVLVVAPYAGHTAAIADLHPGQSLIATLIANGLPRIALTDWKSATPEMKNLTIDTHLAELNVCVDELGGRVDLVGLCQGGWLAAAYAARFPDKVRSLVAAGAPLDTQAGNGVLKHLVATIPRSAYTKLVAAGDGLMRGTTMLSGWKNVLPAQNCLNEYVDLYDRADESCYQARTAAFEEWYDILNDLPGRWYLQTIEWIFRGNLLAEGGFPALGHKVALKDITCPCYLLAGADDDVTPPEQVFAAAAHLGTPGDQIEQSLAPGGHVGLFMGHRPLAEQWPAIAQWIAARQAE
ncbi:alpha/beta fold hydrolase [Actibacterium sp. D379-3]